MMIETTTLCYRWSARRSRNCTIGCDIAATQTDGIRSSSATAVRCWSFVGARPDGLLDPAVYIYLLLATRMNMKLERQQGGEDATALFEQLCCEVAVRFLGGPGDQVGAMVFGTGRLGDQRDDGEPIDRRVS